MNSEGRHLSKTVPEELEYIPAGYKQPSKHRGTLEKLTYQTWDSFSYEEQTKEAWVYLPYGYSDDQLNIVIEKIKQSEVVVIGSPLYWHNICGSVRNMLDCFYGLVPKGSLDRRTLYFLFQGAELEKWMIETGEYTMKHFAELYGMRYMGMATNRSEAVKLSEKL